MRFSIKLSEFYKYNTEELASLILYHKKLYYTGKSIISDAEYDTLEEALRHKDPNHSVLSLVGYELGKSMQKVRHTVPLLSLAKTYSVADLLEFLKKEECIAIDKLDGMALSLKYDGSGKLTVAATRGNGESGENVTAHILHVLGIPKRIPLQAKHKDFSFEVRGEIYFPLSQFKNFEHLFDSVRNAVPGTLGRKDEESAANVLRILKFAPYDLLVFHSNGTPLTALEFASLFEIESDYVAKLELLKNFGFQYESDFFTPMTTHFLSEENLTDFLKTRFAAYRDHHIDGIVFRIRKEHVWEALGNTAHHPRGSLAFKQAGETAITEILDIEQSVGRSSKITFRAKLNPVTLSGAKISYATLHNAAFIEQGNYSVGSQVEVIRSGEVIPAIIKLITPGPHPYALPKFCLCGSVAIRSGPDLFCTAGNACAFRDQESLVYFISSLDMLGISDKIILKLRAAGLLSEPADLFRIQIEDLLKIEGFAKKSAENFVATVQNQTQIPLAKFLTALGLKRGGEVKCKEVAKKCGSLNNVLDLKVDSLMAEKGWAQKSAQDFIESLHEKKSIIDNLLKYVTVMNDTSTSQSSDMLKHPYYGKNICITGALSRPRDEYKALLEKVGAKFVNSVSRKTHLLVCNEASQSTKYTEAVNLGIPIVSEEEFIKTL